MSVLSKGGEREAHGAVPAQTSSTVPMGSSLVRSALGFVDTDGNGIDDRFERDDGRAKESEGRKEGASQPDTLESAPLFQARRSEGAPSPVALHRTGIPEFELPPDAEIHFPIGQEMRGALELAVQKWMEPYEALMAA